MADNLVNRVLTMTIPQFFKDYTDAMAKMNLEAHWARRHSIFSFNQGGSKIEARVRLARGSAKGYTGGFEKFTHTATSPLQIATIEWRGFCDSLVVTQAEKWQNKGKEAIVKVLPALMAMMRDDLNDEFCTSFHSDGTRLGSLTFHGLAAAIASSATTYADISQSTYTNWDCQRITGTGFTSNPLRMLHQLILACAVGVKGGRSRNMLSLLITDQTQYLNVEQQLQGQVRYTRDLEMAKAGFENIELYGVPFAWSEYAPATTVRGINHNLIEIFCATDDLFETGVATTPPWPILDIGYGVSHLNMLVKNPRGCGIIHTIT